ncbi:SH3 domain-containing protein [Pyxidicoccus fallax]|uniref:SH3 domain-containing protein n=1 Tax=Pyxidicoccus fallax TaxID=394095 RepID=A0A848L9T5_9BACT|nr:SH3 domain-containing protein [Pyxidicoccus fallax]NMO15337.1 SH3 domain-containing protein [Pyxidicoccus fallax]NPC77257.1 SH3 domain-containing protein [Pyxidicoccus fallax]
MTPALLLSLVLSQAPAESIHYTAPASEEEGAKPAADGYDFTVWEPTGKQAKHFIGVDEANLRETPTADGPVVTTLPLGANVRVLERGQERQKVGEYVNHWYRVEYFDTKGTPDTNDDAPVRGWVFGNTLTPFRFEADFDGDGELEVATVVMSADFKIRVRVLEPNVKPPRRVSSVDLTPSGQGYLSVKGGPATVRLVAAKTAGLPLVQVDSAPEACGDFSTGYVSYTVPGNKKGVLGKAKVALELAGLSDAPNYSEYKVSFQPKQKGLTVVRTNTEEDESEKTTKTTERTRYKLVDGVFSEVKPAGSAVAETQP